MDNQALLDTPPRAVTASDLTQFLSYRLMRLHSALNAQATAILAGHGLLLGQWRIIAICGEGVAHTSRDLGKFFGLDPAFVSRTLRSLESAGHVIISRRDTDRRLLFVALTESGQALYETVLPIMQERQQALLDALSEEERAMIFPILDKLETAAERRSFSG